jgi:hypothetical protein
VGVFGAFENVDEGVPFPEGEGVHFEGHWQPESSLAFLKGLGDPVLDNCGGRGLMRIWLRLLLEGRIWV